MAWTAFETPPAGHLGASMGSILVVDDDTGVAELLGDLLGGAGYAVRHAWSGTTALARLNEAPADLIILDLMLPDTDGLTLLVDLNGCTAAPVIVCTGFADLRNRLLSFKLGAVDVISKPFHGRELLARVAVALRHTHGGEIPSPHRAATASDSPAEPDELRLEDLVVHRTRHATIAGVGGFRLTPIQYRLLTALMRSVGQIVPRAELAERVWGYFDHGISRSLDVHVRRLRVKLNTAAPAGLRIASLRGVGYRLEAPRRPRAG